MEISRLNLNVTVFCSEPDFRIAAALSDHSCAVYSLNAESLSRTVTLTHNNAPIVGIKFSPTSRNIIYTATSDGHITAFDLRAKGKIGIEFKGNYVCTAFL